MYINAPSTFKPVYAKCSYTIETTIPKSSQSALKIKLVFKCSLTTVFFSLGPGTRLHECTSINYTPRCE